MAARLLFACAGTLVTAPAAPTQTPLPRIIVPSVIVAEVVWGKPFQQQFGRSLKLEVELLGGPRSAQNGIYVSVLNLRNPEGQQFVLLPELINGMQSNFIGAMAYAGADPKEVSDILVTTLESARKGEKELTYFTDRLNRSQLQRVEKANLTLGHHGLSDDVYEQAQEVIDRLEKRTAIFKVLAYRLAKDPNSPNALRIDYLKFSFTVPEVRPPSTSRESTPRARPGQLME